MNVQLPAYDNCYTPQRKIVQARMPEMKNMTVIKCIKACDNLSLALLKVRSENIKLIWVITIEFMLGLGLGLGLGLTLVEIIQSIGLLCLYLLMKVMCLE